MDPVAEHLAGTVGHADSAPAACPGYGGNERGGYLRALRIGTAGPAGVKYRLSQLKQAMIPDAFVGPIPSIALSSSYRDPRAAVPGTYLGYPFCERPDIWFFMTLLMIASMRARCPRGRRPFPRDPSPVAGPLGEVPHLFHWRSQKGARAKRGRSFPCNSQTPVFSYILILLHPHPPPRASG